MVLQVLCSLNMKAEGMNDSDEERSTKVEVFYVDFGNIETVGVENLRDLLPRFMELPAQVVRCSLADVQPLVTDVFEGKVFLLYFKWFAVKFLLTVNLIIMEETSYFRNIIYKYHHPTACS